MSSSAASASAPRGNRSMLGVALIMTVLAGLIGTAVYLIVIRNNPAPTPGPPSPPPRASCGAGYAPCVTGVCSNDGSNVCVNCFASNASSCAAGTSCDPKSGNCTASGGGGGGGATCDNTGHRSCPVGFMCVAGSCVPAPCNNANAAPCPSGTVCDPVSGKCVAPPPTNCSSPGSPACPSGTSCDASTGQCAVPKDCVPPCQVGFTCDGFGNCISNW